MDAASYTSLDDALDSLSACGSALANGNFNHAPMVAEALCSMGQPAAVMPWLEHYRPRMLPRGAPDEVIGADNWRAALGRRGSFAAWCAFFAEELREARWQSVLDTWMSRLAPGISAAATHGAIRVGHAVRAVSREETPARWRELGDALASWAASYRELPATSRTAGGTLTPRRALAAIPLLPPELRWPGSITAQLALLADLPEFGPAAAATGLSGEIAPLLAELTELFTRVYLANVHNIPTAIAFIHGVTSLTALGHIAPHVDEATGRSLLRYGWQAGCGLYACYGGETAFAEDIAASGEDADSLVERALANGDEHVIKFTEACLYRHRLAPSPVYGAAAAHVRGVIGAH